MSAKNIYFLCLIFVTVVSKHALCMELNVLGKKIPQEKASTLQPWDDSKVMKGSLIACRSGEAFIYASLCQKNKDNTYAVIVFQEIKDNGVQSTHGRVVSSDILRILAQ